MPTNRVACSMTRLLCLRLHARPSGATLDHRHTAMTGHPFRLDLPESYIRGTTCQTPACQDRGEAEQPMIHGLGSRRSVATGVTAGPATQTRDDPGIPCEQTFIMRIAQLLGTPLQADVEGAQR